VTVAIRRLNAKSPEFAEQLSQLLTRPEERDAGLATTVADIIASVREKGDEALLHLTRRHDEHPAESLDELLLGPADMSAALACLDSTTREALEAAAERIKDYHLRQKAESWSFEDALGNRLGQQVTPMDRVGIYVPGGKASYPSSVLMNAIPAQVAGVG